MQRAAFVPGGFCAALAGGRARSSRRAACARRAPSAQLTGAGLAAKSYQLEEMEDAATSTSAVYLSADGTVQFGRTDGPSPDRALGRWEFSEVDGALTMQIERWFGAEKIPFCVRRVLRGHVDSKKSIGDLPLFEGAMFMEPTGFALEDALGHFALIEATDDLPNENFDISKL